jgi:threo-3-hydroxy-L-aspartate ammonia-lyase
MSRPDEPAGAAAPAPPDGIVPDVVSLDDIRSAADRIRTAVHRTPLVPLPPDARSGSDAQDTVYAKAENLQRTGAFKLRGAYNFLARMTPEDRRQGVVTHSSGNHAQAVACAAKSFGVPAVVVIPEGAPQVKVDRTRAWGAEVVRCEPSADARERVAGQIAASRGLTLVPPFDHPWIVAGQGTIGLEIAADLPDVANVLVCVGGGGLIAGIATAMRALLPGVRVIGVEPELAADAAESFRMGELRRWSAADTGRTIADGVRTQALGRLPWRIVQDAVDGFVTVSEADILAAASWYLREARLVVEPTGALTLAAYRRARAAGGILAAGPSVLLVSGGNADRTTLVRLLEGDPGSRGNAD